MKLKCVIHDQSNFEDKFLGQPRICIWIEDFRNISKGFNFCKVGLTGVDNNTMLITLHSKKVKGSKKLNEK